MLGRPSAIEMRELPYVIEGLRFPVRLTRTMIDKLVPRSDALNAPPFSMYT